MSSRIKNVAIAVSAALCLGVGSTAAHGAQIFWTDWTGADLDPGSGFRAQGTITTGSTSLTVTYTNPNGVGFYQPSGLDGRNIENFIGEADRKCRHRQSG